MCPDQRMEIWVERYVAAILEINSEKIPSRVHAAKMAICDRIEELDGSGSLSERAALNRAMNALLELQDLYPGDSQLKLVSRVNPLRDVA